VAEKSRIFPPSLHPKDKSRSNEDSLQGQ
jgi:hypothetical protein